MSWQAPYFFSNFIKYLVNVLPSHVNTVKFAVCLEYPLPKRSKPNNFGMERALPQVHLPQWHNLAPLIVVWPVTMQSHIEERRHIILEENFPTEYVKWVERVYLMHSEPRMFMTPYSKLALNNITELQLNLIHPDPVNPYYV